MALPTLLDALEALPAFSRLANTLPAPRARVTVGGLHGSSDAVLFAALARRFPQRLFVVLGSTVPDAERWLADLQALVEAPTTAGATAAEPGVAALPDSPIALYPP